MQRIDYWVGIPLCALLSLWNRVVRLVRRRSATPRRVLFIELSEMGSAILAHSALVHVRELAEPGQLYFLIFEKNAPSVALLDTVPAANILAIKDTSFGALVTSMLAVLIRIRRLRIDTVIDLELFSRFTMLISYLSGATTRIGFDNYTSEGLYRGSLLTHRVLYNHHQHMTLNFLALVVALEAPAAELPLLKRDLRPLMLPPPRCHIGEQERRAVFTRLQGECASVGTDTPLIVFNPDPGPALPIRGWPIEYFAALARQLLARVPRALIVVMGLPESAPLARVIVEGAGDERCIDFTGKTRSLHEVVALLDMARVLVTSDGGPAHMASIAGVRCVVLFGPETPNLYAPLGANVTALYAHLSCSPCLAAANHRYTVCTDNKCMQAIEVAKVLDTVLRDIALSQPVRAAAEGRALPAMEARQDRSACQWDDHWRAEQRKGVRDVIATFVRQRVFAPVVDHFVNRYFPERGTFLEAGCGSGEASSQIGKKRRTLIALDISSEAVKRARSITVYDQRVNGDLLRLPFREGSIGGIWNLGVMEHFHEPDILGIFAEFDRVLAPGGRVILFWPADFSSSLLVMRTLEFFIRFRRPDFHFYPDEVSRIHSFGHVTAIVRKSRLRLVAMHFTWRNVYSDIVVVLEAAKKS